MPRSIPLLLLLPFTMAMPATAEPAPGPAEKKIFDLVVVEATPGGIAPCARAC